jgi:hypothetical protein
MGIKFRCHACDKKLHVKAFLAGRRGVCPKCGAKIRIPLASEESSPAKAAHRDAARVTSAAGPGSARHDAPAARAAEAATLAASAGRASAGTGVRAAAHDPIAEAPDAVWYVRPPTGGQFGPADGTIMRRWLNEGRVSADALVWREGWPEWKTAGPVFPSLAGSDLLAPALAASAAVADVDADFTFAAARQAGGQPHGARAHAGPAGRNVALVATLVVLCVALLVALVVVLRTQG